MENSWEWVSKLDNICFTYDIGKSYIEMDPNVGDYFDSDDKYQEVLAQQDGKFITIINLEFHFEDVESLADYLEVGDLLLPNGKSRITYEQFEGFIAALLNYGSRQKFWVMFTNDPDFVSK